jgi:hypothetical protein
MTNQLLLDIPTKKAIELKIGDQIRLPPRYNNLIVTVTYRGTNRFRKGFQQVQFEPALPNSCYSVALKWNELVDMTE